MKRIFACATVAACLMGAASASAATIYKTVVIDLNGPAPGVSISNGSVTAFGSSFAPISIADGDQLDLTVLFAGSESITVSGATTFSAKLTAVSGTSLATLVQTGSLALIGTGYTSGPVTMTNDPVLLQNSTPSDTIGQSIDAEAFFPPLDNVTFYGLHYIGTVDYTGASDGATLNYNLPSIKVAADSFTINGSAVPEPATWAMMLIGFGGVGAALRSRRATKVTFA